METVPSSDGNMSIPVGVAHQVFQNGITASSEQGDPELDADLQSGGPDPYCPKNGRPHAALLDFDIYECHICKADLTLLKVDDIKPSAKDNDRDSDNESNYVRDYESSYGRSYDSDDVDRGRDLQESNPKTFYAQHLLEFRDRYGDQVKRQEWRKGPFNLSATRGAEADDFLVFQAIIRLQTNKSVQRSHKKNLLAHHARYQFSYQGTVLRIFSNTIIHALKTVSSYPNSLTVGVPFTLEEPYTIIGHHLSALKKHASKINVEKDTDGESETETRPVKPGVAAMEHFNIFFNWLKEAEYEAKLIKEGERNARGLCTFQMLWLILKPSTTVYMTSQGVLGGYVIEYVEVTTLTGSGGDNGVGILSATSLDGMAYIVKLWNLRYDSRFVRRKMTTVLIPFFKGEKEISTLKTVPIEFYKERQPGTTRTNMENLGQLWYQSLRGRQVYYKGRSIKEPEKQLEGRAYIDPNGRALAKLDQDEDDDLSIPLRGKYSDVMDEVRCPCDQCHGLRGHPAPDFPWKDYDVIDPKDVESLELPDSPHGSRHRYLVCDHKVWAIMLKTRTWELLDIAHCSDPMFNENALEKLVMPKERKDMIKALVVKFKDTKTHDKPSNSWRADFVEGKGEGTIFLLHGSPGVGKTFTAECIAEFTARPLISLTCADIGTDEVEIESKLELWLGRAERWGAVLLIDEADIFLERRQITDLKRNSLVSVFLRCLEYYRGILFLTTNRVGHFDDAFISRIHVVIKYEALGEAERKQIWTQFFDKLDAERRDFEISRNARTYVLGDEPDALYKQPWNGREIRNVFQTAVALAEYRTQTEKGNLEPILKLKDFEQVCDMTKHFKKYLEGISGLNEEQRAFRDRARVGTQEF